MTLFPKNSSRNTEEICFATGSLVMYEHDGKPLLGVVRTYKKQKYLIFNERGREVEMAANRLHPLPGKMPSDISTQEKQVEYLEQLSERAQAQGAKLNLEEIWTFVVEEEKEEYSSEELSELYFGKSDLEKHLALRYGLMADSIYFKRKKEGFQPRTPEIIEELRKAEAVKERKARLLAKTVEEFKARLKDKALPFSDEIMEIVTEVEAFAADVPGRDNNQQKEMRDLLATLGKELGLDLQGPLPKQAFYLLLKVHHFTADTNLLLIRHSFPTKFTEEALAEAEQVVVPRSLTECSPEEQRYRRDLTNLRIITIDDAQTKDMDDGLSIEKVADGYRLGIHISDVASAFPSGSALDEAARARATSLYLPEQTYPMLPPKLSDEKLSLVAGQLRRAFTCMVDLDQSFAVRHVEFFPSLIKTSAKVSYDQADDLLEHGNDDELSLLYHIAATRETERIENGAVKVVKREAGIVIDEHGRVSIFEINEHTPARMLVSELMILCNAAIANFAVEHGIPMLFRGQENPDEEQENNGEELPEGPAQDYVMRGKLKRSEVSLTAMPHSSLALPAYLQATSPIRRYSDLVNQRQIMSYLINGQPAISEDELRRAIVETEEELKTAGLISKKTRRYWLMKYLGQLGKKKQPIEGTVVRTDMKYPLVELEQVYINAILKTDEAVKLGQTVTLRIAGVDPHEDYLKLELMR